MTFDIQHHIKHFYLHLGCITYMWMTSYIPTVGSGTTLGYRCSDADAALFWASAPAAW